VASIDAEAIDELTAAVTALIPGGVPPPTVALHPRTVRPVGLGGFVGLHHDPDGEIVGRRIDATISVSVVADDPDALANAAAAVNRALVAADRTALRRTGVLKLALDDVGPQTTVTGHGADLRQTLTFSVLFEFLKRPEEPEGIIEEIPLDVTIV
jgi:hypothetical protein